VDANSNPRTVSSLNSVTFLNDRNNRVQGFDRSEDVINGQGGNDRLDGRAGDDLLRGGLGNDELWGGNGNDILIGNDGSDRLEGGNGDDLMEGGSGGDRFVYTSSRSFRTYDFGKDTIIDFTSGSDKIVLDNDTFTSLRSRTGNGFSIASEFAVVASDADAALSQALIVYNSTNGRLFYNQNKAATGLGSGALFATLSGSPAIAISDFTIQS
ncbi:MAG TPA: calcium-binding protein, partial [Allocoleopsis sp.]